MKPTSTFRSTYQLRQKIINYSLNFNQNEINTDIPKYFDGKKYFNVNLTKLRIHAPNLIEAYVIFYDYLNLNLKKLNKTDLYTDLYNIFNDDYDEIYDNNGNFIVSEENFNYNDTLWLEKDDDILWLEQNNRKILTKTWL